MDQIKGKDTECFLCGNVITEKDIEKGNIPVKANNIPGYVHRRCRGEMTVNIISNPISTTNLHGELKKIIGE